MLTAEQTHGVCTWAQECDASLLTHVHEICTFAEEAIARMHGIAPADHAQRSHLLLPLGSCYHDTASARVVATGLKEQLDAPTLMCPPTLHCRITALG